MSLDFPDRKKWLAIRNTPANLWRKLWRPFYHAGTYVRPRADPKENARLARFQKVCNGNFEKRRVSA